MGQIRKRNYCVTVSVVAVAGAVSVVVVVVVVVSGAVVVSVVGAGTSTGASTATGAEGEGTVATGAVLVVVLAAAAGAAVGAVLLAAGLVTIFRLTLSCFFRIDAWNPSISIWSLPMSANALSTKDCRAASSGVSPDANLRLR